MAYLLQGSSILDEDILLGSLADTHHQGSRGGESHGTGTGYHQDADGREDGMWQIFLSANEIPCEEGQQGDAAHGRHEDEGNLVDHPLYGSLGALSLLYHAYHIGEDRLLSDLLSLEAESALTDNRSCQDLITGFLLYGDSLTRHHRLVDIGDGIAYHQSVHRYLLTGTYLDRITGLECRQGHFHHLTRINEMCRLGSQFHQGADSGCRPVLGTLLHQSACQYEGDDHHRGIEIGMPLDALAAPVGVAPERIESTEEERDTCRESHQCVHIGRGVRQLSCCIHIELPARIQDVQ